MCRCSASSRSCACGRRAHTRRVCNRSAARSHAPRDRASRGTLARGARGCGRACAFAVCGVVLSWRRNLTPSADSGTQPRHSATPYRLPPAVCAVHARKRPGTRTQPGGSRAAVPLLAMQAPCVDEAALVEALRQRLRGLAPAALAERFQLTRLPLLCDDGVTPFTAPLLSHRAFGCTDGRRAVADLLLLRTRTRRARCCSALRRSATRPQSPSLPRRGRSSGSRSAYWAR
jgi:hypothetical protein